MICWNSFARTVRFLLKWSRYSQIDFVIQWYICLIVLYFHGYVRNDTRRSIVIVFEPKLLKPWSYSCEKPITPNCVIISNQSQAECGEADDKQPYRILNYQVFYVMHTLWRLFTSNWSDLQIQNPARSIKNMSTGKTQKRSSYLQAWWYLMCITTKDIPVAIS